MEADLFLTIKQSKKKNLYLNQVLVSLVLNAEFWKSGKRL